MPSTMPLKHVTYTQPQTTGHTGRRLVLAPRSFERIVDLKPGWWNDEALGNSRWNSNDFAQLLDATMAPDGCVLIADLTQKHGYHWTRMDLSILWKLAGFKKMLEVLSGRIGQLRIHYGYDVGIDATQSFDFDCNGGDSVVHLISGGVWHDLFQVYHRWPVSSIDSEWASALMTIGGLPEPVHVERGMGSLVNPGFECPYDEIVEVHEGWNSQSFTTYATVRKTD